MHTNAWLACMYVFTYIHHTYELPMEAGRVCWISLGCITDSFKAHYECLELNLVLCKSNTFSPLLIVSPDSQFEFYALIFLQDTRLVYLYRHIAHINYANIHFCSLYSFIPITKEH